MSRAIVNFFLDLALLVVFLALMFVSVVVRFVFPPLVASSGWQLGGMNLGDWMNLQFILVAVMTLGILIHVMLHWSWIMGIVATKLMSGKKAKIDEGTQTIYGVGFLIVILNIVGLAIAVAALSIQGPS